MSSILVARLCVVSYGRSGVSLYVVCTFYYDERKIMLTINTVSGPPESERDVGKLLV